MGRDCIWCQRDDRLHGQGDEACWESTGFSCRSSDGSARSHVLIICSNNINFEVMLLSIDGEIIRFLHRAPGPSQMESQVFGYNEVANIIWNEDCSFSSICPCVKIQSV